VYSKRRHSIVVRKHKPHLLDFLQVTPSYFTDTRRRVAGNPSVFSHLSSFFYHSALNYITGTVVTGLAFCAAEDLSMRELSVFDIIGPSMIGPSSSHTAGALRIALMARTMIHGRLRSAHFILYGSFASTGQGHGTDRALAAGILGYKPHDPRIRHSLEKAAESGITLDFVNDTDRSDLHPNTVDIRLEDEGGGVVTVRGESIGGGAAVIRMLNCVEVDFTGEYSTIVVEHRDERGVLAYITGVLSDCGINIARAKLFRQSKGELAYTIIEADEVISDTVIERIRKPDNIYDATLIAF